MYPTARGVFFPGYCESYDSHATRCDYFAVRIFWFAWFAYTCESCESLIRMTHINASIAIHMIRMIRNCANHANHWLAWLAQSHLNASRASYIIRMIRKCSTHMIRRFANLRLRESYDSQSANHMRIIVSSEVFSFKIQVSLEASFHKIKRMFIVGTCIPYLKAYF